jgi:hypothetical protein
VQGLAILSNHLQLFLGVDKIRIDFESGFELFFRFSESPSLNHHFAEFIMSHIVVRTKGESFTIKGNRLLSVAACLSLLEVLAKRAVTVARLLLLNLLSRQEIVDFFALPGDLFFLLSKLFRLFFQGLRTATGENTRSKKDRTDGC